MSTKQWIWIRLLVVLLAASAAWCILRAAGLNWSDVTPERLRAYVMSFGWKAPIIYLVLFAQPLVPLPASVMAMAAGLAFGLTGGFFTTLTAAMCRALGQFLIARRVGREAVVLLLHGRMSRWDRAIGEQGFWATLGMRFMPGLPFDVVNLSLGCSQVSFGAYALATLLALISMLFFWVWIGFSLSTPGPMIWQLGAIGALLIGLWFLTRRLRTTS